MDPGLFKHYEDAIRGLPPGQLTAKDLMTKSFLLREEGSVAVYYVPFEGVNEKARVVLVGITPGFTQMAIAFEAVRDTLAAGASTERALMAAQEDASFAGSMRTNLNKMLDEVGLPEMLGIEATDELFSNRIDLLHSTSALRDPVFVAGKNYTGSSPKIQKSQVLRETVLENLGPELQAVPEAVVIPLGLAVEGALQVLTDAGALDPARCCFGFPHPSGANGHRKPTFERNRGQIAETLRTWFIGH